MLTPSVHSKPVQGAPAARSLQHVRWDMVTGKELFRRADAPVSDRPWKLSPDGALRVSYNGKGLQRVCDVSSARCVANLEGKYDYLWPVAWSPDSRMIAGVCRFGIEKPLTIAVWEVSTGAKCVASLRS